MDNQTYRKFEDALHEFGKPLMRTLQRLLMDQGVGPFTELCEVDRLKACGLGFISDNNSDFFVELLIIDGSEVGLPAESLGLKLVFSDQLTGSTWVPAVNSNRLDCTDPSDMRKRLIQMSGSLSGLARVIREEWRSGDDYCSSRLPDREVAG